VSTRTQRVLLWWSLAGAVVWVVDLRFLLHMFPPPSATWTSAQIAHFYTQYSTEIKLGAALSSWVAGFFLPLATVIAVQIRRHEKGRPLWSILCLISGAMVSIFAVLPPILWGVAAFTPSRAPEITAIMHELGVLSYITTDQYFVFLWVGVAVICLTPNSVVHSPFPRWFGYVTIWVTLIIEAAPIAFLTRTGPFAWNGLFVFWVIFIVFGVWAAIQAILLFRAIAGQERNEALSIAAGPVNAPA
jgi:hypothetical protein